MKLINRSTLLGITIVLAVVLLCYTFLRTFTSIKLDAAGEKYLMNGIMIAALGIFVMNRRVTAQEKKESEEKAKLEAEKFEHDDNSDESANKNEENIETTNDLTESDAEISNDSEK